MNRTRGTGSVGGKPRSAEREPAKEKRRSRNGKQCTKNKKQRTRNGELSMENEQWKTRRTKRQRQRLPITLASGLSFITYRAIMHYLVQESLTSMGAELLWCTSVLEPTVHRPPYWTGAVSQKTWTIRYTYYRIVFPNMCRIWSSWSFQRAGVAGQITYEVSAGH